jgi:hypothetical protein
MVGDVTIGHDHEGDVVISIVTLDGQVLRLLPTPDEAEVLAAQLSAHAASARRHAATEAGH